MKYLPGTIVQRRDGYVFVKRHDGRMQPQHRMVAEQRLGRELKEGEVVIRKRPDRMNNTWPNLVVVQHALTKFKYLPQARVIFVPKTIEKATNRALAGADRLHRQELVH